MTGKDSNNGSVERQDGRHATLLRVEGTNTSNLSASKKGTKVTQATEAIENEIAPEERWWALYSTTRRATTETLAEHREDRASDYRNDLSTSQREALQNSAEWLREKDDEYEANERRDYVVVEADPRESAVRAPADSLAARNKHLKHRLKSTLGSKLGIGSNGDGDSADTNTQANADNNPTEDGGGRIEDANVEEHDTSADSSTEKVNTDDGYGEDITEGVLTGDPLEEVLSKRAGKVADAFEGVDGITVERADAREHVEVLRAYWTSRPGSAEPGLMELFERDWGDDHQTPAERILAEGGYNVNGKTIRVGDTYCRTFWVSEWPLYPAPMFLDELFTLTGVNIDTKLHATPINRRKAPDEVKEEALDVDAEGIEREEHTPLSAITIESKREAYARAYQMLEEENARAWYMNGYVTVRADSRKQLREDAEEVKRTLESPPAKCVAVAPERSQHECFISASPFGDDIYDRKASPARERVTFSGGLGAMFPFVSVSFDEEEGILWGRNKHTDEPMIIDPFARGTAPHIITIGMSRAGKTHFTEEALAAWYLDRDDRTLIVCDTQGGFGALTNKCEGEHIVIDSGQPINPFDIKAPPEEYWDKAEAVPDEPVGGFDGSTGLENKQFDPLGSKIDEVAQLVVSLAQAGLAEGGEGGATSDVSGGDLYKLARYLAGVTYAEAGIERKDFATHASPSPTFRDFVSTAYDVRDGIVEGRHTLGGEVAGVDDPVGEIRNRKKNIDALLTGLIELIEPGRYSHLMGEGSIDLLDEDVRMAYLDLRQFDGDADVEKSIGLQIALSQISQKIKQAPGQTIFLLDEAHVLYGSKRIVQWLERASREWARYEACMWSVSQSPEEFVHRLDSVESGQENKRQVIREQTAMRQVFYSPETDGETLSKFGLGAKEINTAKNELTPGRGHDHSECLIQLNDQEGWLRSKIETVPLCYDQDEMAGEQGAERASMNGYDELSEIVAVGGIGKSYGEQLYAEGIETPEDLLATDPGTTVSITNAVPAEVDRWYENALEIISNGADVKSQQSDSVTESESENEAEIEIGTTPDSEPETETGPSTEVGAETKTETATTAETPNPTETAIPPTGTSAESNGIEITRVDGIGETYGERLCAEGIETRSDLLATEQETVVSITNAAPGEVDRWYENAEVNGDGVAAADGGSPSDD